MEVVAALDSCCNYLIVIKFCKNEGEQEETKKKTRGIQQRDAWDKHSPTRTGTSLQMLCDAKTELESQTRSSCIENRIKLGPPNNR